MTPEVTRRIFLGSGIGLFALSGCTSWAGRPQWMGGQKNKKEEPKGRVTRLTKVGDMVRPYINYLQVESVGLVVGLPGTGGDPAEGMARSEMLAEMKVRGVENPNAILRSTSTSIVNVRTIIAPGMKVGDPLDVEVSSADPLTTSLRGGRMLEAKLTEKQRFRDRVRSGRTFAVATGPVLVDPSATPDTSEGKALVTRGIILGGGRVTQERPLSIRMRPDFQMGKYAKCVQDAINLHFSWYDPGNGLRIDAATAKTGVDIELKVHPRYVHNTSRYLRVVMSLPAIETTDDRLRRLQRLEMELLDPQKTAQAAVELEAMGKEAIPALKKGLVSENPGVRLCAAEALAYLGEGAAATVLGKLTVEYPEYRLWTISALSSLDDYSSVEQLLTLLNSQSVSTRYGAFRGLTQLRPGHPRIAGEMIGNRFWFHVVEVHAEPMVHVTKTKRPELSIFGDDIRLKGPFALEAGATIIVTCREETPDQVRVSWFSPGEQDQIRLVTTRLEDVVRTIVELGGDYPDVVQMLQNAKKCGALTCRFEMDALPKEERNISLSSEPNSKSSGFRLKNPLPDLFSSSGRISMGGGVTPGEEVEQQIVTPEEEENAGIFSWLRSDKEKTTGNTLEKDEAEKE